MSRSRPVAKRVEGSCTCLVALDGLAWQGLSNSSSSCRPILGQDRCNECGTYGCAKNRAPTILLPAAENALMQRVSGWVGVIFTDSTIGSNCGVMRGGGGGRAAKKLSLTSGPNTIPAFLAQRAATALACTQTVKPVLS